MAMQILIDEAKLPASSNDTWVFPVLDGEVRRKWLVDGFDLALWFKEVMGRYPAHAKDRDTWDDLKANWSQLEKRFYRELEKQVELGTIITVDGGRISALDREDVRNVPVSELPPLTESQREVARKMKVPEEEYSRNFLALQRGKTRLLEKVEALARFLWEQLGQLAPSGEIKRVALSTIEQRCDVDLVVEGSHIPVRIRESIVDDFFEAGSPEAEARIIRILQTAIKYRSHVLQ